MPVKVGMLVLLVGIAALLRLAVEQSWFALPPELRLAGIALAALGGVAFGWRQRTAGRPFSHAPGSFGDSNQVGEARPF